VGGGGRAFRRNARKELNVELVMFVRFATLRSGGGGGGGGGVFGCFSPRPPKNFFETIKIFFFFYS